MYYNARWYDVALGRFAQADTIIPSVGNSQAWDRYSYAYNNPIYYTDPTGHWSFPSGWLNPFNYPVVSAGFMVTDKLIPGVEISVVAHGNWGAVKNAFQQGSFEYLEELDFSVNLEVSASAGISGEITAVGFIRGSNGDVGDFSGLDLISKDSVPVNVGACIPSVSICGKGTADIDFENETVDSVGYQIGAGQGVDISADAFTLSFPLVSGNLKDNEYEGPNIYKFLDDVWKDIENYGE